MRKFLMKLMMAGVLAAGFASVTATAQAEVRGLAETEATEMNAAPPVYSLIETRKWERTFRQQPPMVPHQVDKYQIDLKANECIKCHDWQFAAKEKAPEMTEAHYKDRDGNQYDSVYRGRWFCTQCHAGQTDAQPLVNNTFQPSTGR